MRRVRVRPRLSAGSMYESIGSVSSVEKIRIMVRVGIVDSQHRGSGMGFHEGWHTRLSRPTNGASPLRRRSRRWAQILTGQARDSPGDVFGIAVEGWSVPTRTDKSTTPMTCRMHEKQQAKTKELVVPQRGRQLNILRVRSLRCCP